MPRGWGLGQSLPVYVTRKSADGITMTYSVSAWISLGAMFLVLTNVWLWGIIGIITAVKVIL